MKELSIEQKAKRYDELKVTAQELEHDGCFDKITLFDLFPELKESDDERIRKAVLGLSYIDGIEPILKKCCVTRRDIREWLEKQGEQKPADKIEQKSAWSEEDETKIKSIIAFLKSPALCCMESNRGIIDESIKYLKSFKGRVQPKHREWTDEDTTMAHTIISDGVRGVGLDRKQVEWLESLNEILCPNHWKPSDEQMTQLKKYCPDNRPLTSLYEQLKKLREE